MRHDSPTTPSPDDTIVAPATGRDPGAIAIVRLSGPSTSAVLERCFRAAGKHKPPDAPRVLVRGTSIAADGAEIDDCLAVWMPAPRSFTGEDAAEIHCHGGPAIVAAILDASVAAGARLAEPGEFSRRAFLNGRMDLAQAEAVADLVVARTDLARRLALRQLRGGLSHRIADQRNALIDVAAEIEAALDFPDEDIEPETHERLAAGIATALADLHAMLTGFEKGRLVREGARVVLTGPPNAGKSSLFNAMLGHERAIVTPHPGTTRDTIECTVDIGGVPVTLVDTAGVRDAQDEIEQLGIRRTAEALANADLVLRVVDATDAGPADAPDLPADARAIVVLNKCDLVTVPPPSAAGEPTVAVSAKTGAGLDALEAALRGALIGVASPEDVALATERHALCVRGAAEALLRAKEGLENGIGGELVMVDLREAILNLGDILGLRLDEEVLDRVFSRFCLGK